MSRFRRRCARAAFLLDAVLVIVCAMLVASAGRASAEAALRPWTHGPRPAFTLERLADGRTELAALEGRVVLLHFFATWCEPCRDEMASLQRLSTDYPERSLAVVAVSVAEPAPRLQRFFQSQPVSFPVLLDPDRAVARAWLIDSLPTTVVIDRALLPVLVAEGGVDWDRSEIRDTLRAHVADAAPD